MVFMGSDPLKRPDLFFLIRKSVALGLRICVSPSATAILSREAIREFKKEGVAHMVVVIDDVMDDDCALEALEEARKVGLATQVQTTVKRWNMHFLDEIAERVEEAKARVWNLLLDGLDTEEFKDVFERLYKISQSASFDVRAAERTAGYVATQVPERSNSDSRAFVFISHTGEIHPSGFLALSAGNVRFDSPVEVYLNSSLFSILRDSDGHPVECRGCDYRNICGGSRAWAYALTGAGSLYA
jgi:radical SAM protein with 4Fe4S-binding SPASM domain